MGAPAGAGATSFASPKTCAPAGNSAPDDAEAPGNATHAPLMPTFEVVEITLETLSTKAIRADGDPPSAGAAAEEAYVIVAATVDELLFEAIGVPLGTYEPTVLGL